MVGAETISSAAIWTGSVESPFAAAAKRAFMWFSPGPWHASHWIPCARSKPFLICASGTPKAVTWQLTHSSALAASAMPFAVAIFLAASEDRVSKAFACSVPFQTPYWSPLVAALWQLLHLSAPMYLLSAAPLALLLATGAVVPRARPSPRKPESASPVRSRPRGPVRFL